MRIILLAHPEFLPSTSMPRYARMLRDGLCAKGHEVEVWSAKPRLLHFFRFSSLRKWAGYFDQFVIFPVELLLKVWCEPRRTLFVVTDHALGPLIPFVKNRPHVVHCHDFIAQRSALGELPFAKTRLSGRIYQWWIRLGFSSARNFISISDQTREDLHRILGRSPEISEMVYNGLNYEFYRMDVESAVAALSDVVPESYAGKFILHVGGNQWYKNRGGVLRIYQEYIKQTMPGTAVPLVMVGAQPPQSLQKLAGEIEGGEITFLAGLSDRQIQACYSIASVLLFPSLMEGFGWPIIEAMACGCPLLVNDRPPMNVLGARVAQVISPPLTGSLDIAEFSRAARNLKHILDTDEVMRERLRQNGYHRVSDFSREDAIQRYESVYGRILSRDDARSS